MRKITILIYLSLCLTGCASLFEHRSFIGEMDYSSDPFFVPGEDFNLVSGDSGQVYRSREDIRKRTPLSARTRKEFRQEESLRRELARKEVELSFRERRNYKEASAYLKSDSERIYYINLSPRERRQYLSARGVQLGRWGSRSSSRGLASVDPYGYGQRNLFLGMSKNEVRRSWGRPARIDVAGNPANQNERWIFYDNGGSRHVFFERGVVQGWQQD